MSRSPSVIVDDRFSLSPVSPARKTRRGRSETPPRKKQKLTKKSDKGPLGKVGKKSAFVPAATTTKKSKNKKSKRGNLVDDDVIVEKTVTKRKKKNRRLNVVGGTSYGGEDDLAMINTHVTSEVADKEVFASGDKIMVSVNFRSSNRNVASSPKRGRSKNVSIQQTSAAAANAKPMCVIDIMQSPYRIIEESPKEVFDVYSDEENDTRKKGGNANNAAASSNNNNVNINSSGNNVGKNQPKASKQKTTPPTDAASQHKAPSPKEAAEKQQQQLQQQNQQQQQQLNVQEHYDGADLIIHTGHKGPCTPPLIGETMIDLTRGPQTPSDPPDDSYDPCNPTESPDISWENQVHEGSQKQLERSFVPTEGDIAMPKLFNPNLQHDSSVVG